MLKRFIVTALAVAASSTALASQILSVGIAPSSVDGDGVIAADVFTTVSAGDSWTAAGVRGVTSNGATLRYAHDPNTGLPILTNPTTANRLSTFFNTPRDAEANGRFNVGRAAAAGQYCPTGPTAMSTDTEVNVAYFASPPETIGSPTVSGAIFRVALDLPAGVLDSGVVIWAGDEAPPTHPIVLFRSFCVNAQQGGTMGATFDVPALTGGNWGLSAIPEPASLALLALGGLLAMRRR